MNYKHTHRNKDTDKKKTLPAVNAGSQDTEYYPLYVESVTLKGSLLQAHINKIKQTIIIMAT